MFCDLAMMFDQLAYEFRLCEQKRSRASAGNELENHHLSSRAHAA
jgi:hypothetical protein